MVIGIENEITNPSSNSISSYLHSLHTNVFGKRHESIPSYQCFWKKAWIYSFIPMLLEKGMNLFLHTNVFGKRHESIPSYQCFWKKAWIYFFIPMFLEKGMNLFLHTKAIGTIIGHTGIYPWQTTSLRQVNAKPEANAIPKHRGNKERVSQLD